MLGKVLAMMSETREDNALMMEQLATDVRQLSSVIQDLTEQVVADQEVVRDLTEQLEILRREKNAE